MKRPAVSGGCARVNETYRLARAAGRSYTPSMRVLLHTHAAAGARTGVGHYTAELLAALRDVRGVRVVPYPNPTLAKVRERLGGGRPPAGWDGGTAVVAAPGAPPKDYRFTLR